MPHPLLMSTSHWPAGDDSWAEYLELQGCLCLCIHWLGVSLVSNRPRENCRSSIVWWVYGHDSRQHEMTCSPTVCPYSLLAAFMLSSMFYNRVYTNSMSQHCCWQHWVLGLLNKNLTFSAPLKLQFKGYNLDLKCHPTCSFVECLMNTG